jgi:hypothetical protein
MMMSRRPAGADADNDELPECERMHLPEKDVYEPRQMLRLRNKAQEYRQSSVLLIPG